VKGVPSFFRPEKELTYLYVEEIELQWQNVSRKISELTGSLKICKMYCGTHVSQM
jgi:hypothetical protein